MITSYMYTNVGGRKVNEDSCITLEDGKENAMCCVMVLEDTEKGRLPLVW